MEKIRYLLVGSVLGIPAGVFPIMSHADALTQQVPTQETVNKNKSDKKNVYRTNFKTYNVSASKKIATAEAHFQHWVESQGYRSDQFRLQTVKNSLIATHYHYQQYEQGLPIDGATMSISVSRKDASIIKSHSQVVEATSTKQTKAAFDVSEQQALTLAWDNIRANGKLRVKPKVEKIWLPTEHGLIATYRVSIAISKPLGDWLVYIDGESGNVIKLDQKAIFEKNGAREIEYKPDHFLSIDKNEMRPLQEALTELQQISKKASNTIALTTGFGAVFDPDPKTALNNDDLTDSSSTSEFNNAYFTRTFPEVTNDNGTYYLKSSWVEIDDFDSPSSAPATSTDGNWQFTRGQNGFDDVNVFYHVDQSQRYIQSLGFSADNGIQYGVIRVDANGANGDDNSYYSPSANTMSFGHGGVNDSEDADVILHEYGHAINYDINSNWGGPDAGAIGEGFGDYWAGSYSLSTLNGDSFFPNRVFTWDGHNEFWPGRILNDVAARYNPSRSYPAHAMVDGVLSDQLWSTPLFQSLLQLMQMGYARDDVNTIILEAQFGLGGGMTMGIMAESIVQTAARLFPGEPHSRVFYQNFTTHNILEGGLDVGALTLTAGDDNVIYPGESVSITVPLTGNSATATNVTGQIDVPDTFNAIVSSSDYADIQPAQTVSNNTDYLFEVPSDTACGTAFDVNFIYSTSINGLAFSGEQNFGLVVGYVESASVIQSTALSIPDNGPEVSSTLSINQPGVIVNNLRVRVNVEHTYVGDLVLGIQSPAGTRVVLHSRTGANQNNLQVTYPDDVEPAQALSAFDGEALSGQWTLFVQDNAGADVGQVTQWEVFFEQSPTCE